MFMHKCIKWLFLDRFHLLGERISSDIYFEIAIVGTCLNCENLMLPLNAFSRPLGRVLQSNKATYCRTQIPHVHRIALGFSTLASEAPHPKIGPTKRTAQNTLSSRTQQIARHFSSTTPKDTAMSSPNSSSGYTVRKNGAPNTLEHRVYIEKDGAPVSAFHDVPLYANEQQTILNMIVEIPRWTNAKMEVSC